MKILKNCTTCTFKNKKTCQNKKNHCWEISFEYILELLEKLPENERNIFFNNENLAVNNLIYRMETGNWEFKGDLL